MEKYCRTGQATDDSITWRMRIACFVTKATDTHSEYVILIAFSRQQWLRERASRTLPVSLILQHAALTFGSALQRINPYPTNVENRVSS